MRLSVFCVHDSAVGAYLQPFFMRSVNEALRSFRATVNSPGHAFSKNPEDYTLFHIGSYDEDTGVFENINHHSLGKALDHIDPEPQQGQLEAVN